MSEEATNQSTVASSSVRTKEEKCIFCQIIAANDPNIILEPRSDKFVVIKDIRPVATHHFLVLSHDHITNAKCLKPCEQDRNLLESMIGAAKQVLLNHGCNLNESRFGFHWPPFFTVGHLHLHAISPVSSMSFFNRYIAFNPSFSYVFVDVDYVRERIKCVDKEETESPNTRNDL